MRVVVAVVGRGHGGGRKVVEVEGVWRCFTLRVHVVEVGQGVMLLVHSKVVLGEVVGVVKEGFHEFVLARIKKRTPGEVLGII